MLLLSGIIKNTCEGYKGSVIIEPEQAIEKADNKCGKNFYLDPILGTFKKEILDDPIIDKILEMIQKAEADKIDFGLKHITNEHSQAVFTNEDKHRRTGRGGEGGCSPPQSLGNSDSLGSERKFGQSQFLKDVSMFI